MTAEMCTRRVVLTLVVIFGGDGEHSVLDVFILVHFGLVQRLVEVRGIIILVCNADPNKLSHWNIKTKQVKNEKIYKSLDYDYIHIHGVACDKPLAPENH